MGFVRIRRGLDGTVRYQALYDDVKGRRRSAGTFRTEKPATRAWQRAEIEIAQGRLGDPRRGQQQLRRYVAEEWLPHHQVEARTRENYTYYLGRHILPALGSMRMIEILPSDVREWVTSLKDDGVSPAVIRYCMTILSAIFTTALNDQVTHLHPCRGVKTPPVPRRPRTIVSPQQFESIYASLPSDVMRLLAELDIETGLRWGELTELRPRDVDFATRMLTVSRVVVELVPKFHPSRQRFLVKQYPKDQEYRRLKLSAQLLAKLKTHINGHGISANDLLFPMPETTPAALQLVADPETLDWTLPNSSGRRYRHGTLSAYTAGGCRCRNCKNSYALYRAQRRANGKDQPRAQRRVDTDTDGHIPRRWFRERVWLPALTAANIDVHVRTHDLRHAHASWLLAGGADLQTVKERLGHASIMTTEKYLHTLPDADETALDALSKVRRRARSAESNPA
jgi:integrase